MVLSNLDRELLKSCLEKQAGSWEDFVERFLGLIKLVVLSSAEIRSISLSDADCDELVTEVFRDLLADDMAILRQFREQSSLGTYLVVTSRRMVVRKLLEILRKSPAEVGTNITAKQSPALEPTLTKPTEKSARGIEARITAE